MFFTPENYPYVHKSFDFQRKALDDNWNKENWAMFMEMGTGKSKIVLDNAGILFLNGDIDTLILIAKKGEYANLIHTQVRDHIHEGLPHKNYLFSTTLAKSKLGKTEFAALLDGDKHLRIVAFNVEGLTRPTAKKQMKEIYAASKAGVMLVVDESTCVKNIKAARSKEVYKWARNKKTKFRRIMTGTPITQSPLDLWGQCWVLGKDVLGFKSFYAFRGRYAQMKTLDLGSRSFQVIEKYVNTEELANKISKFATVLTKDQCLDLPDKIYRRHEVEMTDEQTKLYNDMRDLAMVCLQGHEMEVTNVITQIVKLHQIACGQLKFEDGTYASIDNNRVSALEELIEDYPGKVIIWANYRQTLQDVVSVLTKKYGADAVGAYYGGVKDAERKRVIDEFQNGNTMRFFVANPQSAGYGLTLTAANLVIYYSNSYNLEHRLQSEDRCHRIGQTNKVTYIDLVCPDTVDDKILKSLREKKSLADTIMNARSLQNIL